MPIRRRSTAVVAVALALLIAAPAGSAPERRERRVKKAFTAEGSFYSNTGITHTEFIFKCPEMPASQGVDGYVIELPPYFTTRSSVATVKATGVSVGRQDIELSFYSYGCEQGELFNRAPVEVPPFTRYIIVEDLTGARVDFQLTLTEK